jgi:class 3 adenylate cyclase
MNNLNKETLEEWAGAKRLNLALLFTDIVDSTGIGQKLGDNKWMEDLARHFQQGRELAQKYDCYVVKVIGDAFMVAFRNSTDAVEFAVEFSLNTGVDIIGIRVGIHAGQVQIMDNDIYGLNVNKTARIQSAIEEEGIYISQFIKDDCVKAFGSSTPFKFIRTPKELKNFGNTTLWHVITSDLALSYRKKRVQRNNLLGVQSQSVQPVKSTIDNKLIAPRLTYTSQNPQSQKNDLSDIFKNLPSLDPPKKK